MRYLFLIFLFFSTTILAQENGETSFEYTKRVREELNIIKSLPGEEYYTKIDNHRSALEKYIEHKRRVCNGDFSTVVLTEQGERKQPTNKLSAEERKLCFREMKALQITFINNMFIARKRYLDHLHKERIKELELARDTSIKSLQTTFAKKGMRR